MTQPPPLGPATPLGQPVPPKKKSKLPWILGGVALVLLLCFGGCGAILAANSDEPGTAQPSAATSSAAPATTAPAPTTAAPTTTAPAPPQATTQAPPPPPPPPATIEDGTWVVGEDVPAGTYKATAAVAADCYWSITKSGTNGEQIINNGFPGGGRPKVTIKKGQDFETSSCGIWQKVG